MKHWRMAAAASLLAAMAGAASAGSKGEIIQFGQVVGKREPAPQTPDVVGLMPSNTIYDFRYIDHTDRMEARLCRTFGVTFRLKDYPAFGPPPKVYVRVLHPMLTRPDGVTGNEGGFPTGVSGGETFGGFTFDYSWEMQPGEWTFVILVDGEEQARKTFTITMPPPGGIDSDCGVA